MPNDRDEEGPTESGPRTGERASDAVDGADGESEQDRDAPPADDGSSASASEAARAEAYAFERIPRDRLPPDVQYTPEFDDDWIYPSGAKAGGGRDDVPVQGLELGIVAHGEQLMATVDAVLDALATHYERAGTYPRHRFVADEAAFDRLTDGDVGVVATVQPRSDRYDGLVEHIQALQDESDDDALTPNRDAALRLAAHLATSLVADGFVQDFTVDVHEQGTWDRYRQVGDSVVIERYAPLAAEALYDPLAGPVDLDDPDADDVSELTRAPAYLDVDDATALSKRLDAEADATDESTDDSDDESIEDEATDDAAANDSTGDELTD